MTTRRRAPSTDDRQPPPRRRDDGRDDDVDGDRPRRPRPPPSTAPTTTVQRRHRRRRHRPRSRPTTGRRSSTELSRRRVALYAAPDLARIGEYCMPATDCADQLQAQLGDAIARGEHIEGQQPFDVIAIERCSMARPSPGRRRHRRRIRRRSRPPPARSDRRRRRQRRRRAVELDTTNTRVLSRSPVGVDPSLPWRVVQAETLGAGPDDAAPASQR